METKEGIRVVLRQLFAMFGLLVVVWRQVSVTVEVQVMDFKELPEVLVQVSLITRDLRSRLADG